MQSREEAAAWAVLSRAPGLDIPTLSHALLQTGGARQLLGAKPREFAAFGFSPRFIKFCTSGARGCSDREWKWLNAPQHDIVAFCDPRFPERLRRHADCPTALFVSGQVEVLTEPQIAIVGSRHPTPQGCETALEFAYQLAGRGLTVTSGLAKGIDTAAHNGALRATAITIAVLGSGVDVIYPSENRDLADAIPVQGALVSEFPLGCPPRQRNFPRRNRIIAALSLGTLVVEAQRRSGSLITARCAADQGSEVFAVPGSIHSPLARGCHDLIKQGAKLTETIDDILIELDFSACFRTPTRTAAESVEACRQPAGMDKGHKILLDALGFDPADLETLIGRTGFKAEAVSSMMLILELEGHVQAAPGGRYSRVHRSRG